MVTSTPASAGLAAVLFDMDGLLVDSEPQWFAAERRTVEQLGATWGTKEQTDLLGSNLQFAADYMVRHARSDRSIDDVMQMLLDHMTAELSAQVTFRAGAVELLQQLAAAGVPLALVTSSVRVHVEVILDHLPEGPFHCTVAADDVTQLKPHPEPYLRALSLLGVPAERTVALEDSPTGVAAAEAAGCHVVAVPSVVPIDPAPGRTVWPTLAGVGPADIVALVTRS